MSQHKENIDRRPIFLMYKYQPIVIFLMMLYHLYSYLILKCTVISNLLDLIPFFAIIGIIVIVYNSPVLHNTIFLDVPTFLLTNFIQTRQLP